MLYRSGTVCSTVPPETVAACMMTRVPTTLAAQPAETVRFEVTGAGKLLCAGQHDNACLDHRRYRIALDILSIFSMEGPVSEHKVRCANN